VAPPGVLGELTALPRPLYLDLRGPTSKRKEGKGRERGGRERKGPKGRRKKGVRGREVEWRGGHCLVRPF